LIDQTFINDYYSDRDLHYKLINEHTYAVAKKMILKSSVRQFIKYQQYQAHPCFYLALKMAIKKVLTLRENK